MTELLDTVLPEFHFRERHRIWVRASPETALAAAKQVSLGEMPLARLLFFIRGLPTPPRRSLWNNLISGRFVDLGEIKGREIAGGVIGQMWKWSGGQSPRIAGPVEFASFREAGYAKAALSLAVRPAANRCELVTETRVFATDEAARRAFSRYWVLIRPGSGLIRRLWLGAAKTRAELASN